jgi:pimeloyl-ACP methyl ester carboxylesterase
VPSYAAFVDAALAALGVEQVHLVVHDFGGPIGLAWTASNADRLASLTLIDIGILPGYKWHKLARIWRTPVLGELFQAITTRRGFRVNISRTEPQGLPRPFVETMYDHYDRRTKRAVLKLYRDTDDPGAPDPDLVAALRERDPPALVIWGGGDPYLPSSYAERQKEFLPKAEVNVLPQSGHWPFADDPAEVERLLLAFLSRC